MRPCWSERVFRFDAFDCGDDAAGARGGLWLVWYWLFDIRIRHMADQIWRRGRGLHSAFDQGHWTMGTLQPLDHVQNVWVCLFVCVHLGFIGGVFCVGPFCFDYFGRDASWEFLRQHFTTH